MFETAAITKCLTQRLSWIAIVELIICHGLDKWEFSTFWSLFFNCLFFALGSLLTRASPGEEQAAHAVGEAVELPMHLGRLAAGGLDGFRIARIQLHPGGIELRAQRFKASGIVPGEEETAPSGCEAAAQGGADAPGGTENDVRGGGPAAQEISFA